MEYEVLKPVLTLEESLKGDVVFHDWSKLNTHHELYFEQGTNICQHTKVREGDTEKAFAQADYVVEGEYETSGIQHVCMEGHGAIAKYDRDGLVVWTCAQSPFFMRPAGQSLWPAPEQSAHDHSAHRRRVWKQVGASRRAGGRRSGKED